MDMTGGQEFRSARPLIRFLGAEYGAVGSSLPCDFGDYRLYLIKRVTVYKKVESVRRQGNLTTQKGYAG